MKLAWHVWRRNFASINLFLWNLWKRWMFLHVLSTRPINLPLPDLTEEQDKHWKALGSINKRRFYMLYVSAGFQVLAYLRAGQHIVSSMYVMELMWWTGPLACLVLYSVMFWIRISLQSGIMSLPKVFSELLHQSHTSMSYLLDMCKLQTNLLPPYSLRSQGDKI